MVALQQGLGYLWGCPCLAKGRARFAFVSLMDRDGISGGIRQRGWCSCRSSAMAMGEGQAATSCPPCGGHGDAEPTPGWKLFIP